MSGRIRLGLALALVAGACWARDYYQPPEDGALARVSFYLTAPSSVRYPFRFPPEAAIYTFTDESCANRAEIRQARGPTRKKAGWKSPPYPKLHYASTEVRADTPFTLMFISHGCGPSMTFKPVAGASYEVTYLAGNRCNVSVARVVEGQRPVPEHVWKTPESCQKLLDLLPG